MLQAVQEMEESAQRELDALEKRSRYDREQAAALEAELRAYHTQLAQTRQDLEKLEGSQSQTDRMLAQANEDMADVRTQQAALEAATAVPMPENLRGLKEKQELHTTVIDKAAMLSYVQNLTFETEAK